MKPYQPNESLIDGIKILQALAGSKEPVSCTQLSKDLEIEITRVNRILKTFAYIGITHRTNSRKYIPGSGLHVLGAQSIYGSGLLQSSIKTLRRLTELNLVVGMGVLWMDKVSFIFHWEPGIAFEDAIGRVSLQPATVSGIGMILLSQKSDDEIIKLYQKKDIPGYGKDLDKLLADIAQTREKGYSRVLNNPSKLNIAVNIGNPGYAAIALAGDIEAANEQLYIEKLKHAVQTIEENM
ncbi:MAG: transcriptional regulator [Clostridia bacterium]|jgi:DNA-binding IclR family transcriptional regulator|nr:transcriptional regulator [Clostridia bacterium]